MRKCRLLLCMFILLVMCQSNRTMEEELSGEGEVKRKSTTVREIQPLHKPKHKHYINRNEKVTRRGEVKKQQQNEDPQSRIRLIEEAAEELKSVLNKKTVSRSVKSQVLSRIFDSQGDPKKASLANEIFRKALEPAQPTHGAVGDLGAEMIKVSVLTKPSQKLLSKFMHSTPKQTLHKKHQYFQSMSQQKGEQNLTKAHHNFNQKSITRGNTLKPQDKKIQNIAKLNTRQYKLKLQLIHDKLAKMLAIKRKLYKYKITPKDRLHVNNNTKLKNETLNFDGKTAKLLSLRVSAEENNNAPRMNKSLNVNTTSLRERKDYVIELDDSNNMELDDPGERRHLDSVISLLRRVSLPSNRDVEYIDDADNDQDDDDDDDGYISPQRRRIGQNLFLNSFAQDEEDDDVPPETEEQAYQHSLEHFDDDGRDIMEPRLDEPFGEENIGNYDNEEEQQENYFNNRPSINPYGTTNDLNDGGRTAYGNTNDDGGRTVVMDYDQRKRTFVPY